MLIVVWFYVNSIQLCLFFSNNGKGIEEMLKHYLITVKNCLRVNNLRFGTDCILDNWHLRIWDRASSG